MDVTIIGTGRLAVDVCTGLALITKALRVQLIGRTAKAVSMAVSTLNLRSAAFGSDVLFEGIVEDPTDADRLALIFEASAPKVILCCSSLQSPWEPDSRPSAWGSLVRAGGIGLCAPFHFAIARAMSQAALAVGGVPVILNAAYPDIVNPLLKALDLPVTAGIGNGQITAAALAAALQIPEKRLAVAAHHLHLGPVAPEDDARVWLDGEPLADPSSLLRAQRSVERRTLNATTGFAAARVIHAFLGHLDMTACLPGVLDQPGGYPISINAGRLRLNLPPEVPLESLVAANYDWTAAEGIKIFDAKDGVWFAYTDRVLNALSNSRIILPEILRVSDLDNLIAELHELRRRLRLQSP